MLGITPRLRGIVSIGGLVLPCLEGTTFSMPKNYAVPMVASGDNLFQYQIVEGLQYPTLSINTLVTKNNLTAALLNSWFNRSNDDVASMGALIYWDGARSISVTACKLNMFSIGGSQGELLRCRLVIIGYGAPTLGASKPSGSAFDTSTPTTFKHVSASGGIIIGAPNTEANAIASFDLMMSNNLDISPEMNNTFYPSTCNAGQFTATLRIVQQAAATRPPDFEPPSTVHTCLFTITPPGASAVTFTVENPICTDPEERTQGGYRQMREYNYLCLGKADGTKGVSIA